MKHTAYSDSSDRHPSDVEELYEGILEQTNPEHRKKDLVMLAENILQNHDAGSGTPEGIHVLKMIEQDLSSIWENLGISRDILISEYAKKNNIDVRELKRLEFVLNRTRSRLEHIAAASEEIDTQKKIVRNSRGSFHAGTTRAA